MTDRKNELLERLMQGDMEAYDELFPDMGTEGRESRKEFVMSCIRKQDIGSLWLLLMTLLCGWTGFYPTSESIREKFREIYKEPNQRLADAWDKAVSNAVDKLNHNDNERI